jgi:hypothetical protein
VRKHLAGDVRSGAVNRVFHFSEYHATMEGISKKLTSLAMHPLGPNLQETTTIGGGRTPVPMTESLATLLTKENQFLAEKYDVQYVASGRDLLRETKSSTAKDVVLFANPAFDVASTSMLVKAEDPPNEAASIRGNERGDIEDWIFERLGGTQKESDELTKKFGDWGWKPTDFTPEKATNEELLKIHSPYILHLATHGFFAKEDPTTTQTESESPLKVRQSVTQSKFFKNPMHRSGLALAGAKPRLRPGNETRCHRLKTTGF